MNRLTAWLFCIAVTLPALPQTGPVVITVDAAAARGPMEIWRHGLGQGGLSSEPMFDAEAIRPLRPKLIRLFVQEYFHVYPSRGVYDWTVLDRSVDNILRAGAMPLMSICIKPSALYPVIDQDKVDPSSYEEWDELIYQMVRHYNTVKKCGIRYWEVFNEPDIGEDGGCPGRFTTEAYNRYYEHTARAILRADPTARVGGPALASYRSPLLEGLLKHCSRNQVPLHFVSWHVYSSDPQSLRNSVVQVKRLLAGYPSLQCETILDEWNMSLQRPRQDPAYQPAYALETIHQMREAGLDYSCYYHIRDYHVFEPQFAKFMSRHGSLNMANWWNLTPQFDGLFDFQNVMRPAFFMFKLLSRLAGDRLETVGGDSHVKALAAYDSEQDTLNTLVWNFGLESPPATRVQLAFRNLKGARYAVRRLTLDAATPSNQENDRLRMTRNDTLEKPSTAEDVFDLPPYGVALVSLKNVTR